MILWLKFKIVLAFITFSNFFSYILTTRLIWVLSLMLFIQYLICISQIKFLIQVTQYIAIFLFFLRFFFLSVCKVFPIASYVKTPGLRPYTCRDLCSDQNPLIIWITPDKLFFIWLSSFAGD